MTLTGIIFIDGLREDPPKSERKSLLNEQQKKNHF